VTALCKGFRSVTCYPTRDLYGKIMPVLQSARNVHPDEGCFLL